MITARPSVTRVRPYVPGTPSGHADTSLASNESALGTSRTVRAAVAAAAANAHRYPDSLADELRDALAAEHGVDPDQILIGNGSDELIFLLAWAYIADGGRVVCADPPYRLDEISTVVTGGQLIKVPLVGWTHDLDAMAEIEAEIAHIVNPHNPTGTLRSRAEIERFVEHCRADLVVIDEAYIDFADDPGAVTAMPLAAAGQAAVLRTFSKLHGLAGLRIGYLVADREIVATLRRVRTPFSVNVLSQAAAVAAVRDHDYQHTARQLTRHHRARLTQLLTEAGYRVVPSQANFVLVVTDEPALIARLNEHGISVRPGSSLGLPGTVRISVPSESGLHRLEEILKNTTAPPTNPRSASNASC